MSIPVPHFALGVDIGSTTAKAALLHAGPREASVVAVGYRRHNADIAEAVQTIVREVAGVIDDERVSIVLTGSAGMGLAERARFTFVQEVHAACAYVSRQIPGACALLDIGGEDSKLVFLDPGGRIDARMNGGCAGGTGAFLDQMAALLSVEVAALERLASTGSRVHPVAMRCGVFAKTDVQNLLSTGTPKPDVALSVFHAVANQVIATLTRGRVPAGRVVMTGGPLTFLPTLRRLLADKLGLTSEDALNPPEGAMASAVGAALSPDPTELPLTIPEFLSRVTRAASRDNLAEEEQPLFADPEEYALWSARRFAPVPRVAPENANAEIFLGIDSGSTTTKLVLMDREGRVLADHYEMNQGEPLEAARRGLDALERRLGTTRAHVVRAAAVTGYGEDLVRAGLGIELGVVETEAHLLAARALAREPTFVLDIGGQDMKAIFVRAGQVRRVEVNEACSSGCGSFLQTFADSLSLSLKDLSTAACHARAPRGLGSRCTVFMNSMVKQALRDGAGLEDIAAGLAYSVARNCLYKVLKLRDLEPLGETIVVQGGTFLNPAVQRAFELLIGRRVICPDAAGLAGAWGAALWARDRMVEGRVATNPIDLSVRPELQSKRAARCAGCADRCAVTLLDFVGAGRHVSGNRCERYFHAGRSSVRRGMNHLSAELHLLMDRPLRPDSEPRMRVGLPLALGMYENLPFWATLLVRMGHEVVLSGPSDATMVERAIGAFASESVCLPARVSGAHVAHLRAQGVDQVFFPIVPYEERRTGTLRTFNCPIVTGYPEVATAEASGAPIRVVTPVVSFETPEVLRESARHALAGAGIALSEYDKAFTLALAEYKRFQASRLELGRRAVAQAARSGRRLVVLACRPYHLDDYLNHRLPELMADLGYDVLSSQCLPASPELAPYHVLAQWAYPNRVLDAAAWVANAGDAELVQLNSFGCGPDAIATDEVATLLESRGKAHTVLRIDESTAPGSLRLRLRTLAMNAPADANHRVGVRRSTPPYLAQDRHRTLITAPMDPLLASAVGPELARLGYRVDVTEPTDDVSRELGLKYVNNEVCYPAILTIGDILKALGAGRYRRSEVAVLLPQTGGPCRASNYVPLLRKAMVSAGFGDVPVISLRAGVGEPLNEQPGFRYRKLKLLDLGLQTIAVTDALSMMSRALAPRERTRGEARRLAEELVQEWSTLPRRGLGVAVEFVAHACRKMSAVVTTRHEVQRVGVVGEIYVKYSSYANHNLLPWLVGRGLEPVVPPLTNFFLQEPINARANQDARIDRRVLVPWAARIVDAGASRFLGALNRRLASFPYPVWFPLPRELAQKASRVLSLAHQYGEGWVLAAEVLDMAERGVRKVICLQPFGCLANQVVARGVEQRLRATEPDLQILFLDLDHNTSEANLFNRLTLLVTTAHAAGPGGAGGALDEHM